MDEREVVKQRAMSCNVSNRDKIIIAIECGKEWFLEIKEEAHINSLNYFKQALCYAKRDGCIVEVKCGKYIVFKGECK